MVIIDDASTDGSGQLIEYFLRGNNKTKGWYRLMRNGERRGSLQNLYEAVIEHCKEDEIVVPIYGSDEMLGTKVFQLLNARYQASPLEVAYTNYFQGFPQNQTYVPVSLSAYEGRSVDYRA
jgi:hypothetical protein